MSDRAVNNEEIEIDLQRLMQTLMRKGWRIVIAAILCAILTFLGTFFFITPEYQSTAMFYVNNNSLSLGEASLSISSADISASRGLVKSYIVILKTRETLNDVIDYADVDLTTRELKGMLSAESVDGTEIFQVVVTSEDPQEAEAVADAIGYVLPKRISSIIEGTSAKVVESAVYPAAPSSPNYVRNTITGFVLGLAVTILLITLKDFVDTTIRNEEDIAQNCKYPVLSEVPDMMSHPKGSYYNSYITPKPGEKEDPRQLPIVGSGISAAATEAYKLLRTKLQFSFADDEACRVIGVSSALTGEGKSLSSANLAYSLSQLNMRVLLIDCDMRRSSQCKKLPIKRTPGLSDFLSGQSKADTLIQVCGLAGEENAFHVISAGRTPPNPIELLSSARMKKTLEKLRGNYDYILLDLPPVGEVSDALAVAKLTDGILVVVRQDYCDRVALGDAIRQFEFVGSKILGVVLNCTAENGGKYGKKYYRRYYNQYLKNSRTSGKKAKKK